MLLSALLKEIYTITSEQDVAVDRIILDSRYVEPGDLFIAASGSKQHGKAFVEEAIAKGAVAVVTDHDDIVVLKEQLVPVITLPLTPELISQIAERFYQYPTQDLTLIGVTGTNGKTSVTYFTQAILNHLQQACGVIGTTGFGYSHFHTLQHTTPDNVRLQSVFAELKNQQAKHVVMEVSSHALDQKRVANLKFKGAIFTNLTHDHLDYHGSMEQYGQAKLRLFTDYPIQFAVINIDDPFSKVILQQLKPEIKIYRYSVRDQSAELFADNIRVHQKGTSFSLRSIWGDCDCEVNVYGTFNISNILAAIATVCALGFDFDIISTALKRLSAVPGRMETFSVKDKPLVVVDYAHTPDALMKALQALKSHCRGKIWCVFGCGGDRDNEKRPAMGRIAESDAHHLVITNDNPRTEDPDLIVHQILQGIRHPAKAVIELDRKKAIHYAIEHAKAEDIILVAGKGHEDYQEIQGQRYPFDDRIVVQSLLKG